MADSVFIPYLVAAIVLFTLGLLIRKAPLPHVEATPIVVSKEEEMTKTSIFQFLHLWLGVLTLFVYVGAEVIADDTIIAYSIPLWFSANDAKSFTTFTLMAMVATYALGVALIPKYLKQGTALKISASLGIILSIGILITTSK